jgi:hypothetical protein
MHARGGLPKGSGRGSIRAGGTIRKKVALQGLGKACEMLGLSDRLIVFARKTPEPPLQRPLENRLET